MKRIFAGLISATVLVSSFCGCQSGSAQTSGAASGTQASGSAAPVVLKIGYENNPEEPISVACNKWKELLEKESNGTMQIQLFPSSQLGNKTDLIDQMVAGSAVCTIADGAFYSQRGVPDFGIVFAPYLFDTWDQCWKLTESDWYKTQCDKMQTKGVKVLASNWIYGDRHIMTKKPVHSPADLKGMKIRVANSPIFIKGMQALGATPTPMALGDTYTALQQGTIDGLENPASVLYGGKYYEVAKYLVLDSHNKNFTTWCVGDKFFSSLTADQQKLLVKTAKEAGDYNNTLQDKAETDAISKMKEAGVTVYEPNDSEKAEFKSAGENFYSYTDITGSWTPGLHDTVKKILNG